MISQLERKNGAEIAVVTVPETTPASSPKEFTTTLFKYWGIGKKGKDNGVLFLISKGDHRVEIETGYGVEAILPAAKVGNRLFLCANCKKQMEKVDDTTIQPTLSKPEKVAQQLGSVRFEGWKCPDCSQPPNGLGFHRVAYESRSRQFSECPICQELTATRTNSIVEHPTEYSTGKRLIVDECHCCEYYQQREETIPQLPPSSDSNSDSSSGDSGFGSGDSGFGGAGGSW